ncbi:MAG TPA: urea carboxylase-associated family protein [Streptosporangiaceae bacterium]
MAELSRVRVPGGEGRAILVRAGQLARVTDVAGGQVGDLFAFSEADPGEYASAGHTRPAIRKLFPQPGDPVLTNRRRPILTVREDTSPGRHDMLYGACDPVRYVSLGAAPGHRSCAGNLREALGTHNTTLVTVPQPLNVFMDVRPEPDGTLVSHPASSRAGDFIEFRAELDCLVVLSSCPMDILPISAGGITPLDLTVSGE